MEKKLICLAHLPAGAVKPRDAHNYCRSFVIAVGFMMVSV